MKLYTDASRSFVVYSFGTTVFSDSAVMHDDDLFHNTLREAIAQSPDFRVMEMEDTNYLVRFAGPVCGVVQRHFYEAHKCDIIAKATSGGLLPGETLLSFNDISIPESHYYAGIYCRAKLYRDAELMQIECRFAP